VLPDGLANARDAMGVAGKESHILFRVKGMAVQGDAGAERFGSARVPPEEMQTLGFHEPHCGEGPLQCRERKNNSS